jgi:hypothetical protein
MKRVFAILIVVALLFVSGCDVLDMAFGDFVEDPPEPASTNNNGAISEESSPQPEETGAAEMPSETPSEEISAEVRELAMQALDIADSYLAKELSSQEAYEKLYEIYEKINNIYKKDGKASTLLVKADVLLIATPILLEDPAEEVQKSMDTLTDRLSGVSECEG